MNLLSLATSLPENSFTQLECLTALEAAPFWADLNARSRMILEKVLSGEGGIEKRHFCLNSISEAFARDAEQLNQAYELHAPQLAAEAVRKAVEKSGRELAKVDAVFLSSCTGYLCPGVTSYVAEELGLREDVFLQDMTGLGCGAAVPLIRAASGYIAENPEHLIITVSVEVCSAAFFVEDDFGVLISNCIFGDGAAAALWSGRGGAWMVSDFQSIHVPEEREKIRFTNAGGKLRNQLHKTVPQLAGQTVKRLLEKRNLAHGQVDQYITHGGGRDVIEQLEAVIPDLPNQTLSYAREVMRSCGNMSSPSVLFALELFLNDEAEASAEHLWMCAFGAGFSAHACQLVRV